MQHCLSNLILNNLSGKEICVLRQNLSNLFYNKKLNEFLDTSTNGKSGDKSKDSMIFFDPTNDFFLSRNFIVHVFTIFILGKI